MRQKVAIAALLVLGSCTGTPTNPERQSLPSITPSPSRAPIPSPDETAEPPPGPHARLPRAPARLMAAFEANERRLGAAIRTWVDEGAPLGTRATRKVALRALYQQRVYRLLVSRPALAAVVLDRLRPSRRGRVRRIVTAAANLRAGVAPVASTSHLRLARPAAPRTLLRYYERGEARFGIDAAILAALNFVESRFGRIVGPSSAGALGPMQFLPSTWARYGRGDILEPRAAILGAARYLAASGGSTDIRAALHRYNDSDAYVEAVLTYAEEMRRDGRSFYAFYFWQVFVITTRGDVRLTGPGLGPGG